MAQTVSQRDGFPPVHEAGPPPVPRSDPALTDFARRAVVAVLVAGVSLAVAYFLWRGVHVLLQAFAGVLFAVFLAALSDWVSKRTRLPYRWSLAVVVLTLSLAVGGLGYLLWSVLAVQMNEMADTLPRSAEQLKASLAQYTWGKYLVENAPGAAARIAESGQFSRVTGFVSGVASSLEATVVILIVGVFGAAEPGLYKAGFLRLVPPRYRPRAAEAIEAIAFNLRHWLVAQATLMVIIGTTTAVGLWLIGVPLALTLGIIAGVLELIPYVGAWLSAVPAALVALTLGPEYLVYTLALFLFIHVLEGYVLFPLLQSKAVHLPPALTLVAQALMGEMLGVLGLFVAAPLTVAVIVLLRMLYVEDALGDAAGAQGPGDGKQDPCDRRWDENRRGS